MSSKEVKGLLKEAREAIKNKEFAVVLKLCKTILQNDKTNYMAHIFLGLSLLETGPVDQAANAFEKAVQLNPSNILAWNGLSNYYEKLQTEDAQKQLFSVYTSLLQMETNTNKLTELCGKLIHLPIDLEKVIDTIKALRKLTENENLANVAWSSIASVASNVPDLPSPLTDICEEALKFVLSDNELTSRLYYSEYLKILYKQNKYERLYEEAEKMHGLYQTDLTPIEWMCKIYNELVIEKMNLPINKWKIEKHYNFLLRIEKDSSVGLFTKAVQLFEDNLYSDSRNLLRKVTSSRPGLLHAWVLLARCCMKLYDYNEASSAALKAHKLLQSITDSNKNLRQQLDEILPEALSRNTEDEYLKKGIELCRNVLNQEANSIIAQSCLIRCYINLEDYALANKCLANINIDDSNNFIFTLLHAQLLRKQGFLQKALELLENDDVNLSEWWFEVGMLYWDLNEFEKTLVPFLKAAKLDSNCFLYFIQLGHYYQKVNDLDKARRCYEKAFKMNPKCIEVADQLSKIYRLQKNWDGNIALLESVTGGILDSENKWAWLQLGLNYLEQEDYTRAIDTLRFVVRENPTNSHCWESLADAYMARGAYTSALKSYNKAAELSSNSLYPLLQMASIKQALGEYAEAKIDYETILLTNKSYVPALKGLAETCLYQAQQHRKNQLIGLARDNAQIALDMVTIGMQQRNDLSCLWKIAGDCCFLVAKLPEKYCCLLVLRTLAEGRITEGNKVLEQDELYVLAERCYEKGLSLIEDNVLLCHDLATCFLSHALSCANSEKSEQLFKKSFNIVQHCISINPTSWQHWNLMGMIAFSRESRNYALAQHAFIKAVRAENNSAVAWCNLGTFYLILSEFKLANDAFSQAQRADPNYVNSWIGQALIAESLGMEDAMDLFRHSTQLGSQQQGGIGYGNWVCQTLLKAPPHSVLYSIHNMHAIPVACDSLTWYTENNPDDACAWNILGLLRERMGLKSSAAHAFRNALHLCEQKHKDKVRVNYGRLLYQLGKYKDAIEMYKDVQNASFNSGSGLALALFKDSQYEESYEAYEQALHWLTDEQSRQSDLLVALASMAYMFQGPDAAKTLLFQSIQLKPPSLYGLYATLSLGLLHKDLHLSKIVLKELYSMRDNPRCLPHYATLLSYTYLLEDKHSTALRELSKLIHRHPNCPSLWVTLSLLLVRLHKQFPVASLAAAKCAQAALEINRTDMNITKVLCIAYIAYILNNDHAQALKVAQKAVHCYPDVASVWVALIYVVQIKNQNELQNVRMEKLSHVMTVLNSSKSLLEWLNC